MHTHSQSSLSLEEAFVGESQCNGLLMKNYKFVFGKLCTRNTIKTKLITSANNNDLLMTVSQMWHVVQRINLFATQQTHNKEKWEREKENKKPKATRDS